MSKKTAEEHGKPITRRDFISRGLVAGGGLALAPTLGNLLSSSAMAAELTAAASVPYIVFDLSGGAALAGNFLVGNRGGANDLLNSYDMLGWNPRTMTPDARFGLPMAPPAVSKILEGMLSVMSAGAQQNFRMASLLHQGLIDTSQNPLSALALVANSGNLGTKLKRALGSRSSLSGGNSRAAAESENFRPLYISKIDDLTGSLGLGSTFSQLPERSLIKLVKSLRSLSVPQLQRALNSTDSEVLRNFDMTHASLEANVGPAAGLDPRRDTVVAQLYGINANSAANSEPVIRAGLVAGALKRLTGPAVITIGGCDYHDSTQTSGDTKDREIGVEIGRTIELASKLNTPVFIQVITDGGIYPRGGTRIWLGDSNETCMSVVGYYDPRGARGYINNRIQIGNYTNAQGADRTTLIGDSPLLAAHAAFANYLQIEGRIREFDQYAPGVFTSDKLQSVLAFEG